MQIKLLKKSNIVKEAHARIPHSIKMLIFISGEKVGHLLLKRLRDQRPRLTTPRRQPGHHRLHDLRAR